MFSALIGQLEGAEGPERALDCAIAPLDGWKRRTDARDPVWYNDERGISSTAQDFDTYPPNFTHSLDAIVALVERRFPDREWCVAQDLENGGYAGTVGDDHWDEAMGYHLGRHKHAALALCIAFVKAWEAKRGCL